MAGSLLARAVIVERGPWGNMYEFSIAFAVGILGGYLFLQRRYPIRTIAFLPLGVALFLAGYAAAQLNAGSAARMVLTSSRAARACSKVAATVGMALPSSGGRS